MFRTALFVSACVLSASRVFAAGMSSGGCMTNTLVAVYPDVFAGGSAMPGFPAGTCRACYEP